MVNVMVSGIGETLKQLEKVAKKHEMLGSNGSNGSNGSSSKGKGRQIWAKFRWSVEFSKIDGLRNKVSA